MGTLLDEPDSIELGLCEEPRFSALCTPGLPGVGVRVRSTLVPASCPLCLANMSSCHGFSSYSYVLMFIIKTGCGVLRARTRGELFARNRPRQINILLARGNGVPLRPWPDCGQVVADLPRCCDCPCDRQKACMQCLCQSQTAQVMDARGSLAWHFNPRSAIPIGRPSGSLSPILPSSRPLHRLIFP